MFSVKTFFVSDSEYFRKFLSRLKEFINMLPYLEHTLVREEIYYIWPLWTISLNDDFHNKLRTCDFPFVKAFIVCCHTIKYVEPVSESL